MNDAPAAPWWRDAVIYQIYPRSWADANGDGMGDLPGITSRLPYLRDLGVDAVWLSPFYRSPQHDAGYDVADFRDVDPRFGVLSDADDLIRTAHQLGLRVMVDVVPNHLSWDHVWFKEAMAAGPGSPERERFIFRPGKGEAGEEPPNNWVAAFGGLAWERADRDADGVQQWYLHLFDPSQPDVNWNNPEVSEEYESVLRFWLDRGVDGFRIDVAHSLVKAEGLPDIDKPVWDDQAGVNPMWNQPGVHDIYRSWRRLTDSYSVAGKDADRVMCGEAWVPPGSLANYVRPDELHQCFNFEFLVAPWNAKSQRSAIAETLEAAIAVGAPQTWVLSNHDVFRHASRLGLPDATSIVESQGRGPEDVQPDAALGLRRARAATTMMLALPGAAYLYQGEELGLPDDTHVPEDALQDPTWERSGHTVRGRDGCRVPMPWEGDSPSYGFGPGEEAWLPQPAEYGELSVARQTGVEGSTLELYRTLLGLRRELRPGRGELTWRDDLPEGLLGFSVSLEDGDPVTVLVNLSDADVALADLTDATQVLVTSHDDGVDQGVLPVDTAVWVR